MRLIKLIAIGLLAWPAVEIVAFVCVSAAVGFANAVLLLLLMSFAGLFVHCRCPIGPPRDGSGPWWNSSFHSWLCYQRARPCHVVPGVPPFAPSRVPARLCGGPRASPPGHH